MKEFKVLNLYITYGFMDSDGYTFIVLEVAKGKITGKYMLSMALLNINVNISIIK